MLQLLDSIVHLLRDPGAIISWGGYPALALIIFLETGAMIFFLPGDSLLVVAGFYAAKGDLSILALNALLIPLAVLGDACSYYLGAKMGPRLFSKSRSRLFRPEHLQKAHEFYETYGGKAIVMARFVPVVRTFVPVVAGMARMGYKQFATFNILGGSGWIASMTLVGFFLGRRFPVLLQHIEKVIVAVVLLSILPAVLEYFKARHQQARSTTT